MIPKDFKTIAHRDYYERTQAALDCIEENLAADITLPALAREACFSAFHFHRIFLALVGEPVMEYVRRRRLSAAALALAQTGRKVIDIALDYHFNTQDTFTRAFKKTFGFTPAEFCRTRPPLVLRDKTDLLLQQHHRDMVATQGINLQTMLGAASMNTTSAQKEQGLEPKIIYRESFMVAGLAVRTPSGEHPGVEAVCAACEEFFTCKRQMVPDRINEHIDIGVCSTGDILENGEKSTTNEEKNFSYLAGVEVTSLDNIPPGMESRIIPAGTYAVFTYYAGTTPDKISGKDTAILYNYAYGTWLPDSGYEPAGNFDIEMVDGEKVRSDYCELELWIPVKKTE